MRRRRCIPFLIVLPIALTLVAAVPSWGATAGAAQVVDRASPAYAELRDRGPVWIDPASVFEDTRDGQRLVTARAHDFGGWFTAFVLIGSGSILGYWEQDTTGSTISGHAVAVDAHTGAVDLDDILPFSMSVAAADPIEDILREEEEKCEQGWGIVAAIVDCRLTGECTPGPGPAGGTAHFLAPFLCRSSLGKGLKWWSGTNVDRQEITNYGFTVRGFTEIADFHYDSQTCAPAETITAWNETTSQDISSSRCYDFGSYGSGYGPRPRSNVTYFATIYWSDGQKTTRRYDTTNRSVSDLVYHSNNLWPGEYIMHMEMTESTPYMGTHRFGRAFRYYRVTYCPPQSTACN